MSSVHTDALVTLQPVRQNETLDNSRCPHAVKFFLITLHSKRIYIYIYNLLDPLDDIIFFIAQIWSGDVGICIKKYVRSNESSRYNTAASHLPTPDPLKNSAIT